MVGNINNNVSILGQNNLSIVLKNTSQKNLSNSQINNDIKDVVNVSSTNTKAYQIKEKELFSLEAQTKLNSLNVKKDALEDKEKHLQQIKDLSQAIERNTHNKNTQQALFEEFKTTLNTLSSSFKTNEISIPEKVLNSEGIQIIGLDKEVINKLNTISAQEELTSEEIQNSIETVLKSIDKQKSVMNVYINNLSAELTNNFPSYETNNDKEGKTAKTAELSATIARENILQNSQNSITSQANSNVYTAQSLLN